MTPLFSFDHPVVLWTYMRLSILLSSVDLNKTAFPTHSFLSGPEFSEDHVDARRLVSRQRSTSARSDQGETF